VIRWREALESALITDLKNYAEVRRARARVVEVRGHRSELVDRYAAIGYGHELANYLLKQPYTRAPETSVLRGIMLVAQVLDEVKSNTHYSGGQSDIIHVWLGWVSGFEHEGDIALYEHTARRFAEIARPVKMALPDVNVSGAKLSELIGKMNVELHSFRPESVARCAGSTASARSRSLVDSATGLVEHGVRNHGDDSPFVVRSEMTCTPRQLLSAKTGST
jgi:hypothetical protein